MVPVFLSFFILCSEISTLVLHSEFYNMLVLFDNVSLTEAV